MDSTYSIAVTSFLVGLSGAMMPGPVLTVTVGETAARLRGDSASGRPLLRGAVVGPLVVLGHGLLEVALILAIVLGVGNLLTRTPVVGTIGILGGGVLIWMAWGMLRSLKTLTLATPATLAVTRRHPVWAGILTSVSNPYWTLWWATVGLGYLALAARIGPAGLLAFYVGHICSDLVWYSAISCSLVLGHRLLTDRVYRGVVAVCAVFLLGFGCYFGVAGVRLLTA